MKIMNTLKKFGSAVNRKTTAAVVAGSALMATNAIAGPIAEAVKTETDGVKADLYSVGGIVIGFVVVVAIFGIAIGLIRRGGR